MLIELLPVPSARWCKTGYGSAWSVTLHTPKNSAVSCRRRRIEQIQFLPRTRLGANNRTISWMHSAAPGSGQRPNQGLYCRSIIPSCAAYPEL